MKWEQLLNENISERDNSQVLTNIECPKCGRNIYLNNGILLTTYPAKYSYWCSCGWTGVAPIKWTKNLAENIREK